MGTALGNTQHWALLHAEAMYRAWLPCYKAIRQKARQLRGRHVSNASHAKRLRSMGTTQGAKRYSLQTSRRRHPLQAAPADELLAELSTTQGHSQLWFDTAEAVEDAVSEEHSSRRPDAASSWR